MPSRRLDHPRPHRDQLGQSWTLAGTIVAGSAPRSVSPILSIYDGAQVEILLLGAHRDDLVFRERRAAAALLLDVPDVRVPGAFSGIQVGDTVAVEASRGPAGLCLSVAGKRRCGLGISTGRTWGYLLYLEEPTERLRAVVDVLWLVGLFAVGGLFSRSRRETAAVTVIALITVGASTAFTPLVAGPWTEWLGAGLGVVLGSAVAAGLRGMANAAPREALHAEAGASMSASH